MSRLGKGKVLGGQAREILFNVYQYLAKTKMEYNLHYDVANSTSEATGVAVSSIYTIVKEGKAVSASRQLFSTPSNKSKSTSNKILVDDFTKCAIRRKISDMYANQKVVPTISLLQKQLSNENILQCSAGYLHKLLKTMGYKWRRVEQSDSYSRAVSYVLISMDGNTVETQVKQEEPLIQEEDEEIRVKQEELPIPGVSEEHLSHYEEMNIKQEELLIPDEAVETQVKQEEMLIQEEGDQNSLDNYQDIFKYDLKNVKVSDIENHVMAHQTEKKPHQCPNCEYKTVVNSDLKKHIMARHSGEKPQQCPHCNFKTVTKNNLKIHIMARHTGEKPYQCSHCDFKTVQSSYLKVHIMFLHNGEKPYQCPQCDYKAVAQSILKQHVRSRHTGEKPYQCPHCDYKAVTNCVLKKHIMAKHTGKQPHQ